jgi:hypothetical protein
LIERVPFTEDVHVEIVLTDIMALGRFGSSGLFGEMLFNEATITYAGEKDFTLRASVGLGNLLLLSFYIVLSVFFLLSIISIIITRNMPLANIFFSLLPAIVLYPMVSKYFREKKFLDRIGSIGSDTNGK